jgi:hypothetical protein
VRDVEATVDRLVALGGERLGPTASTRDGASLATLRDPWGAVVGLRASRETPADRPIEWHQLHTQDSEEAWELYSTLLGWTHRDTAELPGAGVFRFFAQNGDAPPIGSISNTARLPGVHTHWLFHFPVDDVRTTATRIRDLGGTAMQPFTLPDGRELTACEDPQGAAFGIIRGRALRPSPFDAS